MKINLKEISAIGMLVVGVVLAFISFLLPPPGEINDSVLYIFAQILIYAGSVFGIGVYVEASLPALPRRERAGRRTEEDEKEESPPQK